MPLLRLYFLLVLRNLFSFLYFYFCGFLFFLTHWFLDPLCWFLLGNLLCLGLFRIYLCLLVALQSLLLRMFIFFLLDFIVLLRKTVIFLCIHLFGMWMCGFLRIQVNFFSLFGLTAFFFGGIFESLYGLFMDCLNILLHCFDFFMKLIFSRLFLLFLKRVFLLFLKRLFLLLVSRFLFMSLFLLLASRFL